MTVRDNHMPTANAEAREATTLKAADIIRALVKADEENTLATLNKDNNKSYITTMKTLYAEASDNFHDLLQIVEKMADFGSVDCQEVIREFRNMYINNRS